MIARYRALHLLQQFIVKLAVTMSIAVSVGLALLQISPEWLRYTISIALLFAYFAARDRDAHKLIAQAVRTRIARRSARRGEE